MRTIVLARGQGKIVNGITFERGIPKTVEDQIAAFALESGWFQEVTDLASAISESDIATLSPTEGFVLAPKNLILDDDLNGSRVLLRRPGGIGDNVFVAVFAQHLKNKWPGVKITLGTSEGLIDFMRCFDAFDRVITSDESCRLDITHSSDYVIQFGAVLGSEAQNLLDDKDYFQAHWDRAGLSTPLPAPFPVPSVLGLVSNLSVQEQAAKVLTDSGFFNEPYVVLILGTSNSLKRIRPTTAQQIAEMLCAAGAQRDGRERIRVLALGGQGDRVFKPTTPWVHVAYDLPLTVSAELIRRSRAVIGCDTGLVQFSAALKIPTVSLWGPTDHRLSMDHYGGPQACITAVGRLACAPCKKLRVAHCPHYSAGYAKCMTDVDVVEVCNSAAKLLADNPTHTAAQITAEEAMIQKQATRTSGFSVALLLEHGDHYTGGGYYVWTLAKGFARIPSVSVVLFTDASMDQFAYLLGDAVPAGARMSVVYNTNIENFDTQLRFDLIIGQPIAGGQQAVSFAKRTGCKSAVLLYETPNFIKEHRKGLDTKEEYWAPYVEAMREADHVFCISAQVKKYMIRWKPDEFKRAVRKFKATVLPPVVNTDVADAALASSNPYFLHKQDLIVMIARNEKYKGLRGALQAAAFELPKRTGRKIKVVVIGHGAKKLEGALTDTHTVVEIHQNLPEDVKWAYLRDAKVVIHPSEFEGFGIPPAEGLYAGARVIARRLPTFEHYYEDYVDYYSTDEELLERLEAAFTAWDGLSQVEEDEDDPQGEHVEAERRCRHIINQKLVSNSMTARLSFLLRDELKERASAPSAAVEAVTARPVGTHTGLRVAFVSPWNTQCGIAETTFEIATHLNSTFRVFSYSDVPTLDRDGAEVVRCWERSFDYTDTLTRYISEFDPHVVHIEHEHSNFRNEANLVAFIKAMKGRGSKVVLTLHTYLPSKFIDDMEELCDAVVITKPIEGMSDKFAVLPLPVEQLGPVHRADARRALEIPEPYFVVGSFGMWQTHKGFKEFLDTYDDVSLRSGDKTIYLISGSYPKKSQYHQEIRHQYVKKIGSGAIRLLGDYPAAVEVITRLSGCDVLVFNYSVAHHISSSAAIRTALSAHVPIVCTESPMFSEFIHERDVLKVPFGDNGALTSAILRLKDDLELGKRLVASCDAYAASCTSQKVAALHDALYSRLVYGAPNGEKD